MDGAQHRFGMTEGRTLLVTVDSLRYDHFEYMPRTRSYVDTEHNFAFSTFPETFGSFPAIVGGKYATERGLHRETSVATHLPGKHVGVTTNHLLSPEYNYDEGFDSFTSPRAGGEGIAGRISDRLELGSQAYRIASTMWNAFEHARAKVVRLDKSFRRADDVIAEFFDEIEGHDEWFGWLHFMEPHHPYDPYSAPIDRDRANRLSRRAVAGALPHSEADTVRDLYRREVEELDFELARLWEQIPNDTRVVFTGDHGELLGEDDTWGHPGLLHPLLHRVPFGMSNVDAELGAVVSLIDVPTLLRDEEHELGKESRDVAFALYGDRRAAMNQQHITTYDPSRSEPYRTRTLEGSPAADDDDLIASIREFNIEGGVTRYDADEETLRELGYME
ncbi:hypothetical protein GCM10009000_002850 [Halobacterium noricense]